MQRPLLITSENTVVLGQQLFVICNTQIFTQVQQIHSRVKQPGERTELLTFAVSINTKHENKVLYGKKKKEYSTHMNTVFFSSTPFP